jgi:hypothetical protein
VAKFKNMKNNYVKNKLLFSLGACAILLGLSNSSALAQQKYPTDVDIKKTKSNLSQSIVQLPSLRGINFKVQYILSETVPDDQLSSAIKKASDYQSSNIGDPPRYYYNKVDLNDDGQSEVIVYPFGMGFCGSGGCQTYIFQTEGDNYRPIAMLPVTNQPIIVTEQKTAGWRDLVVYRSGGGITANYHIIRFNGKTYPDSTKEIPSNSTIEGKAFIADDLAQSKGISFTASLPSKSNTMTWQELKTFVEQKKPPSLEGMIPDQFPNQFANGKIAITRLHPGLVGYVVAKEGVNIPNLSNLKELSETDVSFNSVGLENAVELPAVVGSTDSLFNSSQLIVINNWAARYDDKGLRSEARKSEQTTLPNGKKAYYLKQGWCSFSDESAEYSDYLCVSIANSPKTSLEVLKSISASSLNTATQVTEIKMPDSLKLTLEHKESKTETEFIKGDDGY